MKDVGEKRKKKRYIISLANAAAVTLALGTSSAFAQTLPGSADPSRIEPLEQPAISDRPPAKLIIPEVTPSITIPDAAKQVTFTLQQINLDGVTAFSETELTKIYQPYLNQEVPLASLWVLSHLYLKNLKSSKIANLYYYAIMRDLNI